MLGAQVLDFVGGASGKFVSAHDEAIFSRNIKAEFRPVGDHVEGLGAEYRIEPDDADIGRLAKQDIAADVLVFGDFAFFHAAEGWHHVDGGIEIVYARVLIGKPAQEGLHVTLRQGLGGLMPVPGDQPASRQATGQN